ncbi:prepilin peptidase [Citricoccus nitrophenolicus]|uniref:Leader peptidase (Prepilin peptidase)/N-methyltransferase n=1 Tax=Citricoccus muralis TaxID=169134 RepID=A0A3D9LA56_9MICC|nr:prepilin peptidase [Citricoccus muralis]REE02337.1 leader peptidase (prepilin peptidase)/N-methyltransferase [Citricoccus muralis]
MPTILAEAAHDGNWLLLAAVLGSLAVFSVCAAVLTRSDLREHRLPNRWTGTLAAGGAVTLGLACLADDVGWSRFWSMLGGGVAYLGLILLLHLISRTGMGMGDVKLAGGLGLYAGWLGWDQLFGAVVLGFVAGGVVALALVLTRRATGSTHLPFGPAMLLGTAVTLLF